MWGPTETSIVNTMHMVNDADEIALRSGRHAPVGSSHPRMEIAIVDDDLRVLPDGDRGEICMLGASVTHGYLDDPARTAAAYVTIRGQRAYRTQDLGFIGPDGLLRIAGRLGTMAKINGYRVDLAEVEGAARHCRQSIERRRSCAKPSRDCRNCGWRSTARRREPLDILRRRNALRACCQPIWCQASGDRAGPPLTPNGKIDRRAVAACAYGVAAGCA